MAHAAALAADVHVLTTYDFKVWRHASTPFSVDVADAHDALLLQAHEGGAVAAP